MKRVSLLLVVFIFLMTLVGCGGDKEPSDPSKALLPTSSSEYEGKLYTEVQADLETAGFTNIKYEIIYDLITGWLVSDGEIEYVSVGGKKSFRSGAEFDKNVEIIIAYHTFESNKPSEPKDDIEDNYDDKYQGEKYRVNIIVDFDPNIFLDIYDVDLRIDGRKFETLKHGEDGDFEFDLKPGKHKIAFTNVNDTAINGQIELDIQSDLAVTYWIKGHSDNIELKQQNINKNAYYTITLDPNGGEKMAPVKVKAGEKLINPGRPGGMEGYQFLGWHENGTEIEYPYYVNKNVTLKAEWMLIPECDYEYAFYLNQGTELSGKYTQYFLFDVDTNRYVYFYYSTTEKYYEEGSYIGDLESFAKVELISDPDYDDEYNQYFKMSTGSGTYYDCYGYNNKYTRHTTPWEVELILKEIKNNK